jgi:hypothetical protein
MWNRQPVMSVSGLERISYATQRISNALAESPYWKIIHSYWNTTMQQNNFGP